MEQPTNVVMEVYANVLVPNDVESQTLPKVPPPTILNNKPSYGTKYDKIIANTWEKLISKKLKIKINIIKFKSIIPLPTPVELKEDIEVINFLHNINIEIRYQYDGFAKTSVTNNIKILHNVITIDNYPIGGIGSETKYIKQGTYYLQGNTIPVNMIYYVDAKETVILPTGIITTHSERFDSWQ